MKVFVDTNVIAYAFDVNEAAKRQRAISALAGEHEIIISTQVLIEFHNVLTRRFRYTRDETHELIDSLVFDVVPTHRELVMKASATAAASQLSIFDALIVEAAIAAECDELWSEDMTDGQVVNGIRIVNPLRDL